MGRYETVMNLNTAIKMFTSKAFISVDEDS